MKTHQTSQWDSSPYIAEEEEEDDVDGLDSWGEPLWARMKRSDG